MIAYAIGYGHVTTNDAWCSASCTNIHTHTHTHVTYSYTNSGTITCLSEFSDLHLAIQDTMWIVESRTCLPHHYKSANVSLPALASRNCSIIAETTVKSCMVRRISKTDAWLAHACSKGTQQSLASGGTRCEEDECITTLVTPWKSMEKRGQWEWRS